MSNKIFGFRKNKSITEVLIPLEYRKEGTIHKLTGFDVESGVIPCVFTASANFGGGDTIEIDGTNYSIKLTNGVEPTADLFVAGVSVNVLVDADNKIVNFSAGGSSADDFFTEIIDGLENLIVKVGR